MRNKLMLSIAIISVIMAMSCGARKKADATQDSPISLTMGSWRVDDAAAWEAINAEFSKDHPGIVVKFDPTNPPDYNATLRTQLETGTGPDLFFVRSFAAGLELFEAGYIASLSNLPGLMDAFSRGSRAPWSTSTGEPYAVPIMAVSHGIYYNKDVFKANGLDIPETWEDLIADAQILLDADIIPFANGTKDAWDINEVVMMQLIPSNIGGYEGRMAYLDGTRPFNSDEIVASFQQIKDIRPYLPVGFEAVSYYDAGQLFMQGEAAMLFDGSWSISELKKNNLDFEWGVFYPPALSGKDQYVTFHVDAAVGANTASANLEAAMTFLEWLETSKFASLLGNSLPGFFPMTKTVPSLDDPIANEFLVFNNSATGVDIRFVWEKLLAAPSGNIDAYTSLNDNVIAVLKEEKSPVEAADSFNMDLSAWYTP